MSDPVRHAGIWWDSEAELADAVSHAIADADDEHGSAPCLHCNDTAHHVYRKDTGWTCPKATSAARAA